MVGNEEYLAQRLSIIFNDFLAKTQLCPEECSYFSGISDTAFIFVCGNSRLKITEENPDPLKDAGQLCLRTPYAINSVNRPV